MPSISHALLSVSDKTGLVPFAQGLHAAGVTLLSTGGTARHLEAAGIPVHDVARYTNFPEMMDGRVKTLHPKIFGGILCRLDRADDMQSVEQHGMQPLGLVVVNLYPFRETIRKANVTDAEAIEQIDIGGPSLVRAAAKNHIFVTIATDPGQYPDILAEVTRHGDTTLAMRRALAQAAFQHTAAYDAAIAAYFASSPPPSPPPPPPPPSSSTRRSTDDERLSTDFPATFSPTFQRQAILRYGENPHQAAALYANSLGDIAGAGNSLIEAQQLHGKELSYNNWLDLDAALTISESLPGVAAVVIKHTNPCGAASADTLVTAVDKALAGDPVSAFGSILGCNSTVTADVARRLSEPGLFVEAIIAPHFDLESVQILTTVPKWKSNVRLMQTGTRTVRPATWQLRQVDGGILLQETDNLSDQPDTWQVVTQDQPDGGLLAELRFAWSVVRFVKSNAIVLTKDQALRGAGAGQMSRVDSVEIAIDKAGDQAAGSVLASDAFFPFPDSIHRAAAAGIRAIIQPGGSRRDEEVIAACDQHQLPMIFTGRRHFRH